MPKITFPLFILFSFISCNNSNTLFEEISPSKSNVTFKNRLTESEDFNVLKYGYFYNGGGVAAGDFNNDGLIDLYFTGNLVSNKLYLNKGDFEFEDITEKAGVGAVDGWNTGVSLVDINNDGWLDIYVCRSAATPPNLRQNLLFINNGVNSSSKIPTFTEKALEYNLSDPAYSTQASFFDFDKDGDLDVFLLNHSVQQYAGFSRILGSLKKESKFEYSSRLMKNDGKGKFEDVSKDAGIISNVLSFGLGIATTDFNNDGCLDLYISNDYNEEDYLYINQQNGTFKESIREAMGHTSLYSMGSDAADVNNDGLIDLFTLDMQPESNERIKMTSGDDNYDKYNSLIANGFHHQSMRNMLQLNSPLTPRGGVLSSKTKEFPLWGLGGCFSEIAQLSGISNTDWSWSALFGDYDLDGYKDLFITNGYAKDYTNMEFLKFSMESQIESQNTGKIPTKMDIISKMPAIQEANYIYRNKGDLTFENKQKDWGFEEKNMSNGAIQVDLDNDGDLDLVVNNVNQEAKIYKNKAIETTQNSFLRVELKSQNPAFLIGAKVIVHANNSSQIQEFSPVRGYQSSIYAPLVFGFGKAQKIDSVKVIWQNGKFQTIKNPKINLTLILNSKDALFDYNYSEISTTPLLSESYQLNFKHQEDSTNDFKINPLAISMPSYQGPKIAKGDVNKDGIEDFYICGAKGQAGKLFIGTKTNFIEKPQPIFEKDATFEDSDAVLFDADNDSDLDLAVISNNFGMSNFQENRLYLNDGKGNFNSKNNQFGNLIKSQIKAIKTLDFDGDKDFDLIVGIENQNALILENLGSANFKLKEIKNTNNTTEIAIFDINKDKKDDLILTTFFGKTTILLNQKNEFFNPQNISESGLWNTILAEDFDNDGDKDLVLGNWGKNVQFIRNTDNILSLRNVNSPNSDRKIPILCYDQNGKTYPFPARDELMEQMPELKKKYPDYVSYSKATVDEILKDYSKNTSISEASEFESIYLENQNGKFIKHKLPIEAQFSPIFAIAAMDVNKDGFKDLILGGNLEKTRVRIGKMDANYVQVYLNDKKGNFKYHSHLGIKGDVRSLQVVNNQLVVGVNNQKIRIFGF